MEKRLYRSRKEKMFGGVAGGLAEYFDVDPVLMRVVFVALAFVEGMGILAYIILWIVVPQKPDYSWLTSTPSPSGSPSEPAPPQPDLSAGTTVVENRRWKGNMIAGLILVLLGFILLAENLIPYFHIGRFWPVVVIAIGVLLLLPARRNHDGKTQEDVL
jgi:phage shock protein PspC (stress-responsive transcriptional regulator)